MEEKRSGSVHVASFWVGHISPDGTGCQVSDMFSDSSIKKSKAKEELRALTL
jgi:hypothetical protein